MLQDPTFFSGEGRDREEHESLYHSIMMIFTFYHCCASQPALGQGRRGSPRATCRMVVGDTSLRRTSDRAGASVFAGGVHRRCPLWGCPGLRGSGRYGSPAGDLGGHVSMS